MRVLDCCERVGGAEHLGAVGRERDVDRSGVLLVDGREAVGVKTPPQAIVAPRESPLRVGEPPNQLSVAAELTLELRRERACRFGYGVAHRMPAFRSTNV